MNGLILNEINIIVCKINGLDFDVKWMIVDVKLRVIYW